MGGSSKSSVVGYRYFMDLMFGLCYGPVDRVRALIVGDRRAWDGTQDENGIVEIDKPELFGGDEREGGIVGQVQVLMGAGDQTLPDFASTRLPTPSPAFRGALTALYSGQISANNPYIKPFAWQVERITAGWHGGTAWYAAKAPIPLGVYPRTQETADPVLSPIYPDGFYRITGGISIDPNVSLTADQFTGGGDGSILGNTRTTYAPWLSNKAGLIYNEDEEKWERRAVLDSFYPGDAFSPTVLVVGTTTPTGGGAGGCIRVVLSSAITLTEFSFIYAAPAAAQVRCFDQNNVLRDLGGSLPQTTLSPTVDTYREWRAYKLAIPDISPDRIAKIEIVSSPYVVAVDNFTINWPDPWTEPWEEPAPVIDELVAMNGAHMIYQCLTDPAWGMGEPTARIGDSFETAADTLFSEGFGLCMQWARQEEIGAFIRQILDHIGGILYADPKTGLWELKLLRGDYDVNTLPIFDETNIASLESFQRVGYGDMVNEIVAVFRDVTTNRDTPVAVQNLAAIQDQGGVVSATKQYPGIPIASLALRVAQRDLMTASTPLAKARITINREAWSLAPGAVFRLAWPKLGIDQIVMRVIGINYGTLEDGMITIDVAEDVFGLPATSYALEESSVWTETDASAQAVTRQAIVEIPYRSLAAELSSVELSAIDADATYFAALAAEPTPTSQNFNIWSRVGSATYAKSSVGGFSPAAELAAGISASATTITLRAGLNLSQVAVDTLAIIGTGRAAEWVLVKTINTAAPSMTVARGMLDTTPKAHLSGVAVFFDDARGAPETIERATGETVDMKLQTISTGGTLDITTAPIMTATAQQRQARPYPPGNVMINGVAFPTLIDGDPEIEVTWSHRDRRQQTAGFIEQADGSIGPEAGTFYSLELIDASDDSLIDFAQRINATSHVFSGLPTGPIDVKVRLWSERGTSGPTTAVAVTAAATLLAVHGASTAQSIRFDFSGVPISTEQYRIEMLQGGRTIIAYAGNKSALSDLTASFAENIELDPQYVATSTSTSVTITAATVNVPFTYSYGGTGVAFGAPFLESWQAQERAFTFDFGAPGDPNFANVSLLLHGDGVNDSTSFVDSGPAPKTATRLGEAVVSTAQSKFGGASILLPVTHAGSGLSFPASDDFNFGFADFCVELWINSTSTSEARVPIAAANYNQSTGGWVLITYGNGGPLVRFEHLVSWNDVVLNASFVNVHDGAWHHIAVSRAGTNLRLFVDGVIVASSSSSTGAIGRSDTGAQIGYSPEHGAPFIGYIDDVRITKGHARYTANFTPHAVAHLDS